MIHQKVNMIKIMQKQLLEKVKSEAGSSEAGSTFICTALYEIGDMKKSIYKYDKSMYGKQS